MFLYQMMMLDVKFAYIYLCLYHFQIGKTAKDAASKVSHQSEELGRTEAFKTVTKV